jgi:predicted DNA binding protein
MWVAKIKNRHDDCVTTPKAVKHGITVYATPGSSTSDEKHVYNTGFLMLRGPEKSKQNFVRDLKKDKRVMKVEVNKDFIVLLEKRAKDRDEYATFRSKDIMVVKPIYCNPNDGLEYWEVCSWEKKHIMDFLRDIAKVGEPTLMSIQRMKLQDIYHFHISPHLTSKQREALELATEFSYYGVPRKVELQQLAKKMNISRQAFSELLRKAEAKLIPSLTEDFFK